MSPTDSTTTAQVLDAFGGPELWHTGQRVVPVPGPGQLQIRVVATTVNPVDLQTRSGLAIAPQDAVFPMVLGWDAARTVEQLGDGVAGWQIGDRVAAMSFQALEQNGTYAERGNLAAELLAPIPEGLGFEHAAPIPLAGLTAAQLLAWVNLPPGGSLLVDGPAGAVGGLVVQLARRAGLRVVAVTRPEDRDAILALGADQVVERGAFASAVRALHPGGGDAAIDVAGGAATTQALAAVRDGGACITSFTDYDDPSNTLRSERGIRVETHAVHPDTPLLADLLAATGRGELTPTVAQTYALSDAAVAHRRLEQGGVRGKLVLLP